MDKNEILNALIEPALLLDRSGYCKAMNEAWLDSPLRDRAITQKDVEGIEKVLNGHLTRFEQESTITISDRAIVYHMMVTPLYTSENEIHGALVRWFDITGTKETEYELERMAYYDYLTGLYNRRKIRMLLDEEIVKGIQSGSKFAILMIDIDKFKLINDTHGHDVGDLVLKEFSKRLLLSKRDKDVVGRLSGDEFAVLLQDYDDASDIEQFIAAIRYALQEPLIIPDRSLTVPMKISIGYAVYPDHGNSINELFKHADLFMYKHKRRKVVLHRKYKEERSETPC